VKSRVVPEPRVPAALVFPASRLAWQLIEEATGTTAGLEAAKEQLGALTSLTSERGAGVSVTRYWKAGSIDYKKVPVLVGADLERYSGAAREEVQVSGMK
jgi:hypothetical protein